MSDLQKITEICEKHGNTKEIRKAVEEAFIYKELEFEKYHKPVYEVENFDEYKRHLIQLRPDVVVLLNMFYRDPEQSLESAWLDDNENYYAADAECIKDAAHQLLLQLEGHYCTAFIEALRDECNDILKHDEEKKKEILKKMS